LSLAFFRRGSHGKIPVKTESLAEPKITEKANEILGALNNLNIEGRQLKTLIVRASQDGKTLSQLYVKDENFPKLGDVSNLEIIFSEPRSPASVITKRLYNDSEKNPITENSYLEDSILGIKFRYAAESFFQINLPIYEVAVDDIVKSITPYVSADDTVIDFYSGVGTLGLAIAARLHCKVKLVEVNADAVREAQENVARLVASNNNNTTLISTDTDSSNTSEANSSNILSFAKNFAEVLLLSAEDALDYIPEGGVLIVDPPRAGLSDKVISRIQDAKPRLIAYLSCNPVTQARDIAKLQGAYDVTFMRAYNFFPRTVHVENLVVLALQKL
jgi:23S rRNA (uracil1939-C5)-methyltransferase